LQVHDYFAAGADTETTVRDNRQAFQRLRLVPRVMVNVTNIDLTYELLGRFCESTRSMLFAHCCCVRHDTDIYES